MNSTDRVAVALLFSHFTPNLDPCSGFVLGTFVLSMSTTAKYKMGVNQAASFQGSAMKRPNTSTLQVKEDQGPPTKKPKTKIVFVEQQKKKLDIVSHARGRDSEHYADQLPTEKRRVLCACELPAC